MLRNDFDIGDEEFAKVVEPHGKECDEYIRQNVIYDFVAFYLASGYRLNAIWEGNLIPHVNSAVETLAGSVYLKKNFDTERLKKILKEKYNLTVISEDPLIFEE